ncbi:UDP-N-acetylmuramoyl-L-alanine--D-glutamate ligase [Actinomadura craniellae]|uniref:UDP-N-acetylmuramoyl-L-alanine--D-glutamate ligase n=1 Tax=Actinomadura craniellae TaxID=2231787 RepID=UPI001314E450|nr:UDP-N-acetylmuramoyl-L-alanine--D-glutamate ligase [Actinomadura craniellae]
MGQAVPHKDRRLRRVKEHRLRVAVIGHGVEGQAAVEYWRAQGHAVVIHERSGTVEPYGGVEVADEYLAGVESAELIVRSPSVRPDSLPTGIPVTSVIGEFMKRCPARVIGVTGTNGKGTTATAATAILRAAGRTAFVAGNIGTPPLSLLSRIKAEDVVVLELSSFQLMDLTLSPQVAVVLPITPDHLNWHHDLTEYEQAKAAIAAFQSRQDIVVYAADSPPAARIAALSRAQRRVPLGRPEGMDIRPNGIYLGGEQVVDARDVTLPGRHNLFNIAAAVAVTYDLVHGDLDAVRTGVRAMEGLPHRLQTVAIAGGVRWVDDSLSTTPQSTLAATDAYDGPKVLILGGSSKGVSFEDLAAGLRERQVRAVLLIGEEAPHIAAALDAAGVHGYEHAPGPMADLVARAAAVARPGDTVLLSPACAAVGEYRDYADRGKQFDEAIRRRVL